MSVASRPETQLPPVVSWELGEDAEESFDEADYDETTDYSVSSVKGEHAIHGPNGLRIFVGRGNDARLRAEIMAAALDYRLDDVEFNVGLLRHE
jgi:hypothetical protein